MADRDQRPLWFKARRYGWGWTPASAEGWIVTIVVAVALIAGNYLIAILGRPPSEARSIDNLMPRLPAFAVVVMLIVWNALVLVPTIWICWKTGERPRWNWGGRRRGGSTPPDRGPSS